MVNLLARKAVLANLKISTWGATQQDQEVTGEIMTAKKAEKSHGNFTKLLLDRKAMEDIRTACNKARRYHRAHTQPWLQDGTGILPTALYLDYAAYMQKCKGEFEEGVDYFTKQYPREKQKVKVKLGDLYNEEDYPTISEIREKFGFEVVILNMPDKDDFRVSLDKEVIAEIKKTLDTQMNNQLEEAVKSAGERLYRVVQHMAERLKAYKPRNKEIEQKAKNSFRDSLVDNVKELADLLPAFNLSDDPRLAKLHRRVLNELCSTDANTLRENYDVRKQVRNSAENIMKAVSEFLG